MNAKKEVEQFAKDLGSSGLSGLITLIRLNYSMRGIPVEISAVGSELRADFLDDESVKGYRYLIDIIRNAGSYSPKELEAARNALETMKTAILQNGPGSKAERDMFVNAKITRIRYSIGGHYIASHQIV